MPIIHGTDNPEVIDANDNVTNGNDVIFGHGGGDAIFGFGGDDEIIGGAGADSINGGPGIDTATYGDSETGVTVSLATDTGFGGTAEGDTLISIENLTGSFHDDLLIGDDGNNVLNGLGGNDILKGGGGADTLHGVFGNDRLKGGGGADILDGGAGADTMLGGEGWDTYVVDDAGDVVTEYAGEGFDMVETSVSYSLAAGSEVEVLYASGSADLFLIGSHGDNLIVGNAGNNAIVGSYGKDTTTGGSGYDVHVWQSIDEIGSFSLDPDIVTDLNRAEGDILDFGAIDADSDAANGDTAFTFIGTADNPFTAAGQISFAHVNGTDTHILLNADADPAAEAIIQVSGMHPVDAGWFVL